MIPGIFHKFKPVLVGHVQVGKYYIILFCINQLDGVIAIKGSIYFVPILGQYACKPDTKFLLVIYKQNMYGVVLILMFFHSSFYLGVVSMEYYMMNFTMCQIFNRKKSGLLFILFRNGCNVTIQL